MHESDSDDVKSTLNESGELVISGDVSDLLNFANSLISAALTESAVAHIYHDKTTLLSSDSQVKSLVVVNE